MNRQQALFKVLALRCYTLVGLADLLQGERVELDTTIRLELQKRATSLQVALNALQNEDLIPVIVSTQDDRMKLDAEVQRYQSPGPAPHFKEGAFRKPKLEPASNVTERLREMYEQQLARPLETEQERQIKVLNFSTVDAMFSAIRKAPVLRRQLVIEAARVRAQQADKLQLQGLESDAMHKLLRKAEKIGKSQSLDIKKMERRLQQLQAINPERKPCDPPPVPGGGTQCFSKDIPGQSFTAKTY